MNSIFHRISVRKYEDRPVEKEKIMEILKAGMQAPSACNQQPWEFFVVTDKEKIQKLSKVTPYTGCAAGAPVVIVPVYYTEGLVAPSFAQIDMAIAQQNIWLETDALGLGGVWFGIAPMEDRLHWAIRQRQDLSRTDLCLKEYISLRNKNDTEKREGE